MTTSRSSIVRSSQSGIHPGLNKVLERHFEHRWRGDLHPPSVEAFERLQSIVECGPSRDLIFDSGCGNGQSTRQIARLWPGSLVIGVDKSSARLAALGDGALPYVEGNAVWSRMELATFWRLAAGRGWRPRRHFLLYPNPWPKPGHLQRRWHGHPVFPTLLALGGRMEMRSNWEIYAREFAFALECRGAAVQLARVTEGDVVSPFERKYRRSGHVLWSVVAQLPQTTQHAKADQSVP